jgi:hypothetical protein
MNAIEKPVAVPPMIGVRSSNVDAIGHDPAAMALHIRFKGGAHYVYENVPRDVYQQMFSTDSVGRYINQHVKPKFTHRRLP